MSNTKQLPEKYLLYEAPHLLIVHYPAYSALYYKLTGYIEQEEAKDFFEKTLHFIDQTVSSSLLADLTDFKGGFQELASYVNLVFSRKLSEAGIERLAMNTPHSGFGEYTKKIASGKNAQRFLQIQKYTQLKEALQWIEAERKKHNSHRG